MNPCKQCQPRVSNDGIIIINPNKGNCGACRISSKRRHKLKERLIEK